MQSTMRSWVVALYLLSVARVLAAGCAATGSDDEACKRKMLLVTKKTPITREDVLLDDDEASTVTDTTYVIGLSYYHSKVATVPDGYLGENTNLGFGGQFIYLKPIRGPESQACTGFQLVLSGSSKNDLPDHSTGDLAKGAGGDFRYIIPVFGDGKKVKSVYWSESHVKWKNCADDVNMGRGGRYLRLCWKTS